MELVWDIYYAVLKMDDGSWTNVYGTTLWSGDDKDWRIIVSRTAISKRACVRCVCFLCFLWSGLFCCVFVPGTLAINLLYTLLNCDCLVYPVSQSVTT